MNNFEAVQILDPLRDLMDDLEGPYLAEPDAKRTDEAQKALPAHVLRHYDVVVLVL